MMMRDLLYVIPKEQHDKETLTEILTQHPEIQFVSVVGIDFAGNDTDEKIPVSVFLDDMDLFLEGRAVQTDGSSVVLPGIASLNNARVDFEVDKDVNWFVDYNDDNIDPETGKPIGTLRMPSFLVHCDVYVDSRSILKNTLEYMKKELMTIFKKHNKISGLEHINLKDVEDIVFTCATELEFWVKTPADKARVEELSVSQVLQEQYWQRTRGNVRTAMEQAITMLEYYGLEPEMGHKEVGGIKARMDGAGLSHVLEQLEIDWKYSTGMQTADNELIARIVIKEVFRKNGLEVTFQAKPIEGVAGSGEHTHICIMAKMKDGKLVNLFAPTDDKKNFMSALGYGAIMGILKNYEVVNPIISATNDSLNRLKPGFEAPVCIVTSLGHEPAIPSRNRTILAGLVRDIGNPMATRFEMRSPNPFTNTYLAIAAFYMTALDGIVNTYSRSMADLEAELSKKSGEKTAYLETYREYRSEEDVFDDFTAEERDRLFSKPPATVWENLQAFEKYPEKLASLTRGNIIRPEFVNSFMLGAKKRWQFELLNRIIPDYHQEIVDMKPLHKGETVTDCDLSAWGAIQTLRRYIAKDSIAAPSLFSRVKKAFVDGDYAKASELQLELAAKMKEVKDIYMSYRRNIID